MVCRLMHWTLADLYALDVDAYDVLIDLIQEEAIQRNLD